MNVITISGQYGSGSNDIAKQLANRLQWRLIDDEINAHIAYEAGLTEAEAEAYDKRSYTTIDRFLHMMSISATDMTPNLLDMPLPLKIQERLYYQALPQVMDEIARAGNIVVVGRGAQILLADRSNVLHIRIVASFEQRVRAVTESEHVHERHARRLIRYNDHNQRYYHKSRHGCDVDDPLLYDLVINADAFEVESQVDQIHLALKQKALRLLTFQPVTRVSETTSRYIPASTTNRASA